jgi:hypothetical protein
MPDEVYEDPSDDEGLFVRALRGHIRRCVDCHRTEETCTDAVLIVSLLRDEREGRS